MPYPHPFTENVQLNALSFHLLFFLGNGANRGFQGHPYRPVHTYRPAHLYGPAHPCHPKATLTTGLPSLSTPHLKGL